MTTKTLNPKWMSLRDFAKKYGITIKKATYYASSGRLPSRKMGPYGAWYVDLDKWYKLIELYDYIEEESKIQVTGYENGSRIFKYNPETKKEETVPESKNNKNEEDQ